MSTFARIISIFLVTCFVLMVESVVAQNTAKSHPPSGPAKPASVPAPVLSEKQAAEEAMLKRLSPSIVLIRDLGMTCSGIVLDGSGVILAHYYSILTIFPVEIVATVEVQGERKLVTFDRFEVVGVSASTGQVMLRVPLREGRMIPVTPAINAAKVGQECAIVGVKFDEHAKDRTKFTYSLKSGVVSDPRRKLDGTEMIQTDAAITASTLGGGLFDKSGALLGIVTTTALDKNGLGFAVSINNLPRNQFNRWEKPAPDAKVSKEFAEAAIALGSRAYGDLARRLAVFYSPNDTELLVKMSLDAMNQDLSIAFLRRAVELKPDDLVLWDRLANAYHFVSAADQTPERSKLMRAAWRKVIDCVKPGETHEKAFSAAESLIFCREYPDTAYAYVNRWRLTADLEGLALKNLNANFEQSKYGLTDAQLALLDRPNFKFSWAGLDEFVKAGAGRAPAGSGPLTKGQRDSIDQIKTQARPTGAEGKAMILPECPQQVKFARGGCYLAMRFASLRTISILNLATGEFVRHIPIEDPYPTWGVGDRVLLVWTPTNKTLTSYDIETGKPGRSAVIDDTWRIVSIAMSNFRDDEAIISRAQPEPSNGSRPEVELDRMSVSSFSMKALRYERYELGSTDYESFADRDLTLIGTQMSQSVSGRLLLIDGTLARTPKNNEWSESSRPLFSGQYFVSPRGLADRECGEKRAYKQQRLYAVEGEDNCFAVSVKHADGSPHGQIISAKDGKVLLELNIPGAVTWATRWYASGPLRRLVQLDESGLKLTIYDFESISSGTETATQPAANSR